MYFTYFTEFLMNHVGFVAIEDYLANVATKEELEKCKVLIATREAELAKKAESPPAPISRRGCVNKM